jgi:hypothetical protein
VHPVPVGHWPEVPWGREQSSDTLPRTQCLRAVKLIFCRVTLFFKEQTSIINSVKFEVLKTFALPRSTANLTKVSWARGMSITVDARQSSLWNWNTGFMLTLVKTSDSILMSFVSSHIFRNLSCQNLSEFKQRKRVSNGFEQVGTQGCCSIFFSEGGHRDSNESLDYIVTRDKTWVSHYISDSLKSGIMSTLGKKQ